MPGKPAWLNKFSLTPLFFCFGVFFFCFFLSFSGSLPAVFKLLSAERSEASSLPAPCSEQTAGSCPELASQAERRAGRTRVPRSHVRSQGERGARAAAGGWHGCRLQPGLQSRSSNPILGRRGSRVWIRPPSCSLPRGDPLLPAQSPRSAQGVAPSMRCQRHDLHPPWPCPGAGWLGGCIPPACAARPPGGTALQSCTSINAPKGASQDLPLGLKNNFQEGDGRVE